MIASPRDSLLCAVRPISVCAFYWNQIGMLYASFVHFAGRRCVVICLRLYYVCVSVFSFYYLSCSAKPFHIRFPCAIHLAIFNLAHFYYMSYHQNLFGSLFFSISCYLFLYSHILAHFTFSSIALPSQFSYSDDVCVNVCVYFILGSLFAHRFFVVSVCESHDSNTFFDIVYCGMKWLGIHCSAALPRKGRVQWVAAAALDVCGSHIPLPLD